MSQTIHNLHTNQYITTKILLPLYQKYSKLKIIKRLLTRSEK